MEVKDLRTKLERLQGRKYELEQTILNNKRRLRLYKRSLQQHDEALIVVNEVSKITQNQLSYHISDITSMAMETIFKDPYRINLDFVDRRNTTECDITFERNGHIISKPKQSSGLGAVDVGAFALRIAAWSIQNPKTRNVLIQDEPFKHLKGERENILVIEMVQELSKRLGLQVIMIHDERVPLIEIEKGADKVISVSKKCGKSKAIEL